MAREMTSVHAAYGIYDAQQLNYLYEGLSIFTAPYLELGNNAAPGVGSFPKGCISRHFLQRTCVTHTHPTTRLAATSSNIR